LGSAQQGLLGLRNICQPSKEQLETKSQTKAGCDGTPSPLEGGVRRIANSHLGLGYIRRLCLKKKKKREREREREKPNKWGLPGDK
jgi:hypothetical protein